jgi:hypothetical protein
LCREALLIEPIDPHSHRIARSFAWLAAAWAPVTLAAMLGLGLIYFQRKGTAFPLGSSLYLSLGVILCGWILYGLVGYCLQAGRGHPNRWAAGLNAFLFKPTTLLTAYIFLVELVAGCLGILFWLKAGVFLPTYSGGLPVLVWILLSSLCALAFFVRVDRRLKPRLKNAFGAILQEPVIAALAVALSVLVAWIASQSFLLALESRKDPLAHSFIVQILPFILPVLGLNLCLLLSGLLPEKSPPHPPSPDGVVSRFAARMKSSPLLASFLLSLALFLIVFSAFRLGYGSYDDTTMIAMASGYLGGQPTPFLVFSNVLFGLVLQPLFRLNPHVNWAVVLYIAAHFLALWALVWIIFTRLMRPFHRVVALVVVVLFASYFLIHITFTTTAAMAAIAGLALILTALRTQARMLSKPFLAGVGLAFLASLIRLDSLELVLVLLIPGLIVSLRKPQLRKLVPGFLILGLVLIAGLAFDRLYMRQLPDWSAYEDYNLARSDLQDTPRFGNGAGAIQALGWSQNDVTMFSAWFFPDPHTYSLHNLRYIAQHSFASRGDIGSLARFVFDRIVGLQVLPFCGVVLVSWLGLWLSRRSRRSGIVPYVLGATFVGMVFYLSWTMKLPERVLLPSLAAVAILPLGLMDGFGETQHGDTPGPDRVNAHIRFGTTLMLGSLLLLSAFILAQNAAASRLNVQRQQAYRQILTDLDRLQASGAIRQPALLVSPGLGFPWEWADPLGLNYPHLQYLPLNWDTFSPPYNQILRQHHLQTVYQGLYQNENVYLIGRADLTPGIIQFIHQRDGVRLQARRIYSLPQGLGDVEYTGAELVQLVKKP